VRLHDSFDEFHVSIHTSILTDSLICDLYSITASMTSGFSEPPLCLNASTEIDQLRSHSVNQILTSVLLVLFTTRFTQHCLVETKI